MGIWMLQHGLSLEGPGHFVLKSEGSERSALNTPSPSGKYRHRTTDERSACTKYPVSVLLPNILSSLYIRKPRTSLHRLFFFASEPPSRYKGMKETQATELFKLIRRWVDRSSREIVKLVLTVMFAVDADSTCP